MQDQEMEPNKKKKKNYLVGITTHGVDVTIVVSMGTLEQIA